MVVTTPAQVRTGEDRRKVSVRYQRSGLSEGSLLGLKLDSQSIGMDVTLSVLLFFSGLRRVGIELPVDRLDQEVACDRLGQQLRGTELACPRVGLVVATSCEHEHRDILGRRIGAQRLENLESVQIGQREVKEDEVGCVVDNGAQTEHRVLGRQHLMPGARKVHAQEVQERQVVFDDYDLGQACSPRAWRGSAPTIVCGWTGVPASVPISLHLPQYCAAMRLSSERDLIGRIYGRYKPSR